MNTLEKQETAEEPNAMAQELSEADQYPFVKDIVPGTMSGAEMLAYWKASGAFEVWAEQYKDIGPGKKYADSTEYVQAMRARAEDRSHE